MRLLGPTFLRLFGSAFSLNRRGRFASACFTTCVATLLAACALPGPRGSAGAAAATATPATRPTSVAPAPSPSNEPRVVTGGDNKTIELYRVDQNPAHHLGKYHKLHGDKISYVCTYLGAPTRKLFSASWDGDVTVAKLDDLQANPIAEFHHPKAKPSDPKPQVWMVAPSFDGSRALSSTNTGQIRMWDTANGNPLGNFDTPGEPVGGLAFVPNGGAAETQFVSTHGDGTVRLWQINPPQVLKTFDTENDFQVNSVAVTSNGVTAVTAGFDMRVHIFDLTKPEGPPQITIPDKHNGKIWRVAISPDNTKFATACEDRKVRLFAIDGRPYTMPGNAAQDASDTCQSGGVMGVTFIDNNRIVYTAGLHIDPEVVLWDVHAMAPPQP